MKTRPVKATRRGATENPGMALQALPRAAPVPPPGGVAAPRRGLCLREGGEAAAPPGAPALRLLPVPLSCRASWCRFHGPFPMPLPCGCSLRRCPAPAGPAAGAVWARGMALPHAPSRVAGREAAPRARGVPNTPRVPEQGLRCGSAPEGDGLRGSGGAASRVH